MASGWGACDPNNPKNRRRRCSIVVERQSPNATTRLLVDTTPDLREQLLGADIRQLDAVWITHEHADHTHGIDDLRPLAITQRRRVPVYMDDETSTRLRAKFGYVFETPPGSSYPPILNEHRLSAGRATTVQGAGGDITGLPILHHHGEIDALGLRFGSLAYSPDLNGMPDTSLASLAGLEIWIVDALRYTPHPSHFSLDDALRWIDKVKPRRAILTNMHVDLDYEELRAKLPGNIEPAYDGMRVVIPE
ncbi:MAG: MBL fold metallo-hydrolase [Rhizobiales bacterium]|nr:MBL fold metallo-hydrolase [Hyphomicrobiales bacterium]